MRIPPAIRFLGLVALLVLIFGSCGSLTLGALDKAQTAAAGSLVDPTFLAARVGHFLQVLASVLTTAAMQDRDPVALLIPLLRAPHPVVADLSIPTQAARGP